MSLMDIKLVPFNTSAGVSGFYGTNIMPASLLPKQDCVQNSVKCNFYFHKYSTVQKFQVTPLFFFLNCFAFKDIDFLVIR